MPLSIGGGPKTPHADRVGDLLQDLRSESPFPQQERTSYSLVERMHQLYTPGVSIALIEDFDIAWSGGFGVQRRGEEKSVSAETLFQAASVSKPVFALAVMRLAKSRKIDIDVDVNRYLKTWRIPDIGEWSPRVTLRQLLSHTAGTTVHGFEGYSTTALRPTPIETLNGIPPANNSAIVVDAIPGLQARYSGGGTTIAQQVVTDVSGQPLPELMRELVLDPLEMTHSTFEQPLPARFTPSAAVAHSWNGEPVHGGWHVYPEMAAAGLWTTADDLARLGVELMRILRGDDSSLGLDRDAISAMLRPQLPDQRAGQEFWGLGWLCNADGDAFRFGHGGRNNGYVSVITLLPARGQGAVVLLNSSRGFPLRSEIVAAIGRQYGWPPVENVQTIAPTLSHDDYTGVYSDPQGFTFHVTQTEQELRLNFGDQMPLALRPVSSMEFVVGALDAQVRFAASEDNSIISMTVIQGGKVITASRQ